MESNLTSLFVETLDRTLFLNRLRIPQGNEEEIGEYDYQSLESRMRGNSHVRFGAGERPQGPTYRNVRHLTARKDCSQREPSLVRGLRAR